MHRILTHLRSPGPDETRSGRGRIKSHPDILIGILPLLPAGGPGAGGSRRGEQPSREAVRVCAPVSLLHRPACCVHVCACVHVWGAPCAVYTCVPVCMRGGALCALCMCVHMCGSPVRGVCAFVHVLGSPVCLVSRGLLEGKVTSPVLTGPGCVLGLRPQEHGEGATSIRRPRSAWAARRLP